MHAPFYWANPEDDITFKERYHQLLEAAEKGDLSVFHKGAIYGDLFSSAICETCGQSVLHRAAEFGHVVFIERALRKGCNVNYRDVNGLTALHVAAQSGQISIVKYLLEQRIQHASEVFRDKAGQVALHKAVEAGSVECVNLLKFNPGAVSWKDDEGISPLRLAVANKLYSITRQLVDRLEDVYLDDPEERLDLARRFCPDKPEDLLSLAGSNEEMRAALQPKESVREPRAGSLKPWAGSHMLAKPPKLPSPDRAELYRNHVAYVTRYTGRHNSISVEQKRGSYVCDKYTLHQLLYEDEPFIHNARLRSNLWIHLPLNDIKTVKKLIKRLYEASGKSLYSARRVNGFVRDNICENIANEPHLCFREPHFVHQIANADTRWTEQDSDEAEIRSQVTEFSISIPFLDIEKCEELKKLDPWIERHRKVFPSVTHARTLDQAFSLGMKNWRSKDDDQVFTKVLMPESELLTVSELWIWKIDQSTIISAYPQPLECFEPESEKKETDKKESNNESDSDEKKIEGPWLPLFSSVLNVVAEEVVSGTMDVSPEALASLFIQRCGEFEDRAVMLAFAAYTMQQSIKELDFRERFLDLLRDEYRAPEDTSLMNNIFGEVACLQEVKDIREEANMIISVLQSQAEVQNQLLELPFARLQRGERRVASDVIARWHKLIADARIIEDSVKPDPQLQRGVTNLRGCKLNHLLDLKQKQASLDETVSAAREARNTATQNRAILAFTTVTVIFLPLSFVTSLLALKAYDPITPSKGQIAVVLGSAEGATVGAVAVAVLLTLYWDRLQIRPKVVRSRRGSSSTSSSIDTADVLSKRQQARQYVANTTTTIKALLKKRRGGGGDIPEGERNEESSEKEKEEPKPRKSTESNLMKAGLRARSTMLQTMQDDADERDDHSIIGEHKKRRGKPSGDEIPLSPGGIV